MPGLDVFNQVEYSPGGVGEIPLNIPQSSCQNKVLLLSEASAAHTTLNNYKAIKCYKKKKRRRKKVVFSPTYSQ
jgi:hypothetical protein